MINTIPSSILRPHLTPMSGSDPMTGAQGSYLKMLSE